MTYVQSNLLLDEEIKYIGTISIWCLLPQLFLGLILLPLYGLGLLFWIGAAVRYFTTELAVTNKRIMAKFGFIRRNTVELNILRAESIRVDQSVFGRLFNYGSIVVAGSGNPQAPIPGISEPLIFRKQFLEIQEDAEKVARAPLLQETFVWPKQ